MRTYAEEPLLQKDGIVEGKRWFILLAFSWIEFNQVHRSALRSFAPSSTDVPTVSR